MTEPTVPPYAPPPQARRIPLWLQGGLDLLGRYARVLRVTWKHRAQLDSPLRLPHELAFLPAHLELMETPVHPAPRWALRILVATLTVLLILACWGRLDIVAVAQGKLIPTAEVKVIQPAITGVVKSIAVHRGERVQAGQLLLELDPTQARADADRAHKAKLDAQLTIARTQALLQAQQLHHRPHLPRVSGAEPRCQSAEQSLAEGADQILRKEHDVADHEALA